MAAGEMVVMRRIEAADRETQGIILAVRDLAQPLLCMAVSDEGWFRRW